MVFAATVETEVPVMFAIFISPPTKTVPATKPGALRFPPTVIVVGEPPEKIPPPANKSKPALTLPGCTTPLDLNSIGPEPDEILPPAVIDPPAVVIRCAEIFPLAEILPPAVKVPATTCGAKMSPAAVTLESAEVRMPPPAKIFPPAVMLPIESLSS